MALVKRNTAYSLNDIAYTKYGKKLKCTTAGTTSTNPLILDGTSPITDGTVVWEVSEEGTGQGLVDYAPLTPYDVGDIVIYNNNIYKCKTAHTSTTTFDSTKWEEISANDTVKQVLWQGESYTAGDVLNLTDIYTNYDCIICYFVYSETGWEKDNIISSIIIDPSKDYIADASFQEDDTAPIKHYSMSFSGSTATLDVADNLSSTYYVGRIEGIKIGNAFKVNSATKVNLLPASITVTGTTQTLTLLDDVTNYDIIYVNWHEHHSDGINRCFVLTITKEEYEFANSNTTHDSFTDAHQVTPNSVAYVRLLVFPKDGTFEVTTSSNGSNISSVVIDSIIGVSFNCPNNYSTDEQLIGTWVDGSPLYQIAIESTSKNGQGDYKIADLTDLSIDKVVSMRNVIYDSGIGYVNPYHYSSDLWAIAHYNPSDAGLYVSVKGSRLFSRPVYVILEYTKT